MNRRLDAGLEATVAYAEQRRREDGTPGLSLVITEPVETIHLGTLGDADLGAKTPVTPDHLFQIGSIGKSFAALVAVQLHEEGRLDLHAPVTDVLPWFEVRSRFAPITMHHLLAHTAGIAGGSLGLVDPRAEVWALRDTDVAWPPGSRYHYSNAGYKAVGLAIAEVCGRPYPDVLADRVLAPLSMSSTRPAIVPDVRPLQATPYVPMFGDRPFRPGHPLAPATWFEDDGADGSICSTPGDMARYVRALLNGGRTPDGGRLVSPEGFAMFTRPSAAEGGNPYGYGIGLEHIEGRTRLVHGGDMVGFIAHLLADPGAGIGVVVMANGPSRPGAVTRYAASVIEAVRNGGQIPEPPREDRVRFDPTSLAGTYDGEEGTLTFVVRKGSLVVTSREEQTRLEAIDASTPVFFAPNPSLDRALLEFELRDGRAVRVWHGRSSYVRLGDTTKPPVAPAGWRAFEGLFRSNSPWAPALRFVLRGDHLHMVDPVVGVAEALEPVSAGVFRPAGEPPPPERIRFTRELSGEALVAVVDGLAYHRSYEPASPWSGSSR